MTVDPTNAEHRDAPELTPRERDVLAALCQPALQGEVFTEPATVRQLADQVLRLTGSKSKVVERPLPVDDPRQRRPDISRARATLEWQPKVALEEGLKRTIVYFKQILAD